MVCGIFKVILIVLMCLLMLAVQVSLMLVFDRMLQAKDNSTNKENRNK